MIVEGFFLIYQDVIWIVKGVDVCEKYALAIPKYDLRGRKLKHEIVLKLFVEHSSPSDCSPKPMPLIPLSDAEVIDPRDLLDADQIAKDMASIFSCKAGLTGSRAWGEGDDVDLIFYGRECEREVLSVMKDLRARGVTRPPKSGKWDGLGLGARLYRMNKSLLEGIWHNVRYSFRIVGEPRSPRRPAVVTKLKLCGLLRPVSNIVMPYTYELNYDGGKIRVESLRMQHSELGEVQVCIEGVMESRIDGTVLALPPGSKLDVLNWRKQWS